MRPPILTSEQFIRWLHLSIPELSHEVDIHDVRAMVEIGLIFRHKYFLSDDMEVVRKVIAFIKSREERKQAGTIRTCKRCGESLPDKIIGKGRPKEYCDKCQTYRIRERFLKYYKKNKSEIVI